MLNLQLLASGSNTERSKHLRHVLADSKSSEKDLTETLLDSIAAGAIPPSVFPVWVSVTGSAEVVTTGMQQTCSDVVRRHAIKTFGRLLRNEKTFRKTWDSIGGVEGLVSLMSRLSIKDVKQLCTALGGTAFSQSGQKERREAMTKLVDALHPLDFDSNTSKDPRPLRELYSRIVPACTQDLVARWNDELVDRYWWNSQSVQARLVAAHREYFEQQVMEAARSRNKTQKVGSTKLKVLAEKSFTFGLNLLAELSEVDDILGDVPFAFNKSMAIPMSKRCFKRKVDVKSRRRFWQLLGAYLERQPSLTRVMFLRNGSGKLRLPYWRANEVLPEDLDSLGRLFEVLQDQNARAGEAASWIKHSAPSIRYRILRLFLQHLGSTIIDIGPMSSMDIHCPASHELRTEFDVFLLLPRMQSIDLLNKLFYATHRSSKVILQVGDGLKSPSIFSSIFPFSDIDRPGDLTLWTYLLQQSKENKLLHPIRSELGLDSIQKVELLKRKRYAAEAQTSEARGWWAVEALRLAVALGDVGIYADTLGWVGRFTKDSRAVKIIYAKDMLCAREAVSLLCGLPAKDGPHLQRESKQAFSQRIQQCNDVLLKLTERLVLASREADFCYADWVSIFELIKLVLFQRLVKADSFQDATAFSHDDMFECLWQPSQKVLLQVEAIAINSNYGNIQYEEMRGFVDFDPSQHQLLNVKRPASLKFLDELACSRDKLWAENRSKDDPNVLDLEEPWPRGLPAHILLGRHIRCEGELPYILSRVEGVVFCEPQIAARPAPKEKRFKKAIGRCIEDWREAFETYIRMSDMRQKVQRIDQAWSYVTAQLRDLNANIDSFEDFWFEQFKEALENTNTLKHLRRIQKPGWPSRPLPQPEDSISPTEWNPESILPPRMTPSQLTYPTAFACMFASTVEMAISRHKNSDDDSSYQPQIWSRLSSCVRPIHGSLSDALSAAALLTLESFYGSDASLFVKPFPGRSRARFPSMYLDQDYLEAQEENFSSYTLKVLEQRLDNTPPQLMAALASTLLERIIASDEPQNRTLFRACTRVIFLVGKSDSPALSKPLVMRFLANLPQESSWHRRVLNSGFLSRLPVEDLDEFFHQLGQTLLENHGKKSQSLESDRQATTSESTSESERPAMKITTIKLLAQLLGDTPLLSVDSGVRILADLLGHAKHTSIRLAATTTLIAWMKKYGTKQLQMTVTKILKEHAVPVAASLNEDRPESEKSWKAAEAGGALPEVFDSNQGTPRMMELMLTLLGSNFEGCSDTLYSAVSQSMDTYARFARLFLSRHGFELDDLALPIVPVHANILFQVMEQSKPLPRADLFRTFQDYTLATLHPNPKLEAFNQYIMEHAEVRDSSEGKYWLRTWSASPGASDTAHIRPIMRWAVGKLAGDFEESPKLASRGELQDFLFEIAKMKIEESSTTVTNIVEEISIMQDNTVRGIEIVERIIAYIESIRTPEWQCNPSRKPSYLPDVLHFRINMLRLIEKVDALEVGPRTVGIIRDLVAQGRAYEKAIISLKAVIRRLKFNDQTVIELGALENLDSASQPSLADSLRVKLARAMINQHWCNSSKSELVAKQPFWPVVRSWAESEVEQFRNAARNALGDRVLDVLLRGERETQ